MVLCCALHTLHTSLNGIQSLYVLFIYRLILKVRPRRSGVLPSLKLCLEKSMWFHRPDCWLCWASHSSDTFTMSLVKLPQALTSDNLPDLQISTDNKTENLTWEFSRVNNDQKEKTAHNPKHAFKKIIADANNTTPQSNFVIIMDGDKWGVDIIFSYFDFSILSSCSQHLRVSAEAHTQHCLVHHHEIVLKKEISYTWAKLEKVW